MAGMVVSKTNGVKQTNGVRSCFLPCSQSTDRCVIAKSGVSIVTVLSRYTTREL